ncbi:hypothetical protein AcV5_003424 [Taiwanofungus camphoratus]|nr:hypothetical protein AcV5_003424 [Antrodia cinnamomea]
MDQYRTWPDNAILSLHKVDPSQPWVPSPGADLFALPPIRQPRRPVIPHIQQQWHTPQTKEGRKKKYVADDPFERESSGSLLSSLNRKRWKRWFGRREDQQESAKNWPSLHGERRIVSPAEWRAYGYWARPCINDVVVNNATPRTVPRNLSHREIEELFSSLVDTAGEPHPENWIPRVQHPALPPRPSLWPTPPSSPHPPPPASEIQLNPFLRHRPIGKPPILFDLRLHEPLVLLGEMPPVPGDREPWHVPFYSAGPNGAQPATYPAITGLHITALADDTLPRFPWPFIVVPHHPSLPVLIRDVLNACIANFEERMTQEEVDALSEQRKDQTYRAYWQRVTTMVGGRIPGDEDGLRRIDYLGDRAFFRGLEPAPDGDGFMMFVGPP